MFSPVIQGEPRTMRREAQGPMYLQTIASLAPYPPVVRMTPPRAWKSRRPSGVMHDTPSTLRQSSFTSSTAFVL